MGLPENYRDQLRKLLPSGIAWAFEPDSFAYKFFYALGDELARVHGRAIDLLRERDPRRSVELLPEYEKMLGLPGGCGEIADNPTDRQAAIVAKLVSDGGQTKEYFIAVAAGAGIAITITVYDPLYIGFDIGSELTNGPWAYTWEVYSEFEYLHYFTAGISSAGDPVAIGSTKERLECLFEEIAPAHTFTNYVFGS